MREQFGTLSEGDILRLNDGQILRFRTTTTVTECYWCFIFAYGCSKHVEIQEDVQ